MNDEEADETTRLMSDESATQGRDEGRSSRGRRSRRSVQDEQNVYTVRPPQKDEKLLQNFKIIFLLE